MSVETVLAEVESICKSITGVGASGGQGVSELPPLVRAPICYVEARDPRFRRLTAGAGGALETRYEVLITLVLGGPEMAPRRAQEAARPFFERFRLAFWADPTLGGACWSSELTGGVTNLRGYRGANSTPQIRWRLLVRELVTAGAGLETGLAAGQFAYIAIGSPGAEVDISAHCAFAFYSDLASEHDNTPYGAAAESSVPGLPRGWVDLAGKWDAGLNTLLAGLRRATGKSIVLGPAGNGTGKARISAGGYLRDYAIEIDGEGSPVGWRAFFRATEAFSFGSF